MATLGTCTFPAAQSLVDPQIPHSIDNSDLPHFCECFLLHFWYSGGRCCRRLREILLADHTHSSAGDLF